MSAPEYLQNWDADENDWRDDATGSLTFSYCDYCCKAPMRADSIYCSDLCEGRAEGLVCAECTEPLHGRDNSRVCFTCRLQSLDI